MLGETGPQSLQLRQWVADRLRADILEGRLKPGRVAAAGAARPGARCQPDAGARGAQAARGRRGSSSTCRTGASASSSSPRRTSRTSTPAGRSSRAVAARFAANVISDEESASSSVSHEAMTLPHPEDLARIPRAQPPLPRVDLRASRRSYLVRTLAQLWAAFPTMLWSNIPRVAQDVGAGSGRAGHRRARRDRRRAGRPRPRARRAGGPLPHRGGRRGRSWPR